MINKETSLKIKEIWDNYLATNEVVLDTKGKAFNDIDQSRIVAIKEINKLIACYLNNETDVFEFKRSLDSYNKRNNLWGFTATKGQMYFNQLVKCNEQEIEKLNSILKKTIIVPKDLPDALDKIEMLESFTSNIYKKAKDKRKAPNPGSVGYFLSYFWQIHDHLKWPIAYTSLINAFKELRVWVDHSTQKEDYEFFYKLNDEAKLILKSHSDRSISNWDAEHAFWHFAGKPIVIYKKAQGAISDNPAERSEEIKIKGNFNINDYLIPKVAKLIDLGKEAEKSSSAKGVEFEKLVAEIFKQLDFEIEVLGQGSGRNPDAIAKFREENTAFIIDAKAYSKGYSLGTDDRAIKEYINYHSPKLQKEGYKKIGFIIVSNSFKTDLDSFINDLTWNSDIKRFILLTSEALLYLLAYKTKDKLSLSQIIECMVNAGGIITSESIIEEFEDV